MCMLIGMLAYMDMKTQRLYKINPNWNVMRLEFTDQILKVSVTDDMPVIHSADRDFRDGRQTASWIKDNRQMNNLDAYA